MNSKDRVEILAPCGSLDTLKMAVNCGADACYLGLNNFGARAFAPNFSHEEFIEAINYAHLRNVKIYVTLNTLYNEDEINNVLKEVQFLYENNVDAILIQDLGLLHLISLNFPDLELHISTQMHIHNVAGVQFFKNFPNVKRVVLARETPLNIIKECQKIGLDIEIFAYGALCASYSGQCLMSSYIHSRSGNKGMCSQNCRYRYDVIDKKTQKNISHDKYILSMKDLNIIDELPKLLDLGIKSIKIEGRMKRSEYVCQVIRMFRKAVDAYYENKSFKLSEEELKQLKLLFNRGFTKGLINGANKEELFNQNRPNHMGIYLGKVVGFNAKRVKIKLKEDLNQNDGIRFIQKNDYGMSANFIYVNNRLVNHANANEIVELEVNEYIENNAIVVKTTDSLLLNNINDYASKLHRRIPINMHYNATINEPLLLQVTCGDFKIEMQSDEICQKAIKSPTTSKRIIEQLSKVNNTVYSINNITFKQNDDIFISIQAINNLRNNILKKLDEKRLEFKRNINFKYKPKKLIIDDDTSCIIKVQNENQYNALKNISAYIFSTNDIKDCKVYDLIINENANYQNSDIRIVSEIGGLMQDGIKIAGPSLNITNSYAVEFILQYCNKVIISLESNNRQLEKIKSAFYKRNGFIPNIYVMKYGKIELMHIKGDFIFDNINYQDIYLKDAMGDKILIYKDKNNIKHLYLDKAINVENEGNCFISFIDEDPQLCLKIVERIAGKL